MVFTVNERMKRTSEVSCRSHCTVSRCVFIMGGSRILKERGLVHGDGTCSSGPLSHGGGGAWTLVKMALECQQVTKAHMKLC